MQAYKQSSVSKYRYLATLDAKTCTTCGELDGKIFEIAKAKEGVNYPPLHPNDRCTTAVHFDGEDLSKLKRRARDPKTGKTHIVPGDMTYEEWRKGVNEKAGYDVVKASRNIKYKQFSDAAGLPTKMERASSSGYHRVKTPKELAKSKKSGIMLFEKSGAYASKKQFGKHAQDFGLSPNSPEDREKMIAIIDDIIVNKEDLSSGEWRGQNSPVDFYTKGDDVVILKKDKEYVTVMKGGVNNARVKKARNK